MVTLSEGFLAVYLLAGDRNRIGASQMITASISAIRMRIGVIIFEIVV
jgi:hypothetical protein